MLKIDEYEIKTTIPKVTYNQGLDLYLRNKVKRLEALEEGKKSYRIISIVESTYDLNNYDVYLCINNLNYISSFCCSCSEGAKGNLCKHISASIIKLCREMSSIKIINKGNQKLGYNVLDLLMEEENEQAALNLKIKYKFQKDYFNHSLLIWAGTSKDYMVKNIKHFINSIANKSTIEIGRESIEYNKLYLKPEDLNFIDFLLTVNEIDSINEESSYYSFNKLINGKEINLTDKLLKLFFKASCGLNIGVSICDDYFENVPVLSEDMDLTLELCDDEDYVILKNNGQLPIALTKDLDCFFYKEKIYMPSREQLSKLRPIYRELIKSENGHITFPKEEAGKVTSYALNYLKKAFKNLVIADSISKLMVNETLIREYYLDKDNKGKEKITIKVKYKYGNMYYSNNSDNYGDDKIVIRDYEGEKEANKLLLSLGFIKKEEIYELYNDDRIYSFLSSGLSVLKSSGEVYYSEDFKSFKISETHDFFVKVSLNPVDLLEFSFDMEGISKEELIDILKEVRLQKKYYRLSDKTFLPLNNENLKTLSSLLYGLNVNISDLKNESLELPKYASLYINETLKGSSVNLFLQNQVKNIVERVNNYKEQEYTVPPYLSEVLRDYQKSGFKWLKSLSYFGFGGILADEMGLGKTLEALAFISSMYDDNKAMKALIIVPSSLVYNWKAEIEKFAPFLSSIVLSGSKSERKELFENSKDCNIYIISYAVLRRDIDLFDNTIFDCCFVDEAQQIKNPHSQNAHSVKRIKSKNRFALTGTPFENSLTELWSVFDFIIPGYLGSYKKFIQNFETPIVKNGNKVVLEELIKKTRPFLLRRIKKDVAMELPPKIEHKLVVDMTREQKKVYAAYAELAKKEFFKEISDKGLSKSKIKILSLITRLREICCDPMVFDENYKGTSGKTEALLELLEECIVQGHKVIIFSQFTKVLKRLMESIEEKGYSHFYFDGSTEIKDRLTLVNRFNRGEADIFLISLKAGGTGLNITGADIVIHFDPWWNPAVEDQATDRAHRIGQKKNVEVIRLITKGTIEEKIDKLKENKKKLINEVLEVNDSIENPFSSMDEKDITDLFSFN